MEKGGTILPSPSNIKGFVGGAANPVDLQVGPDGMLYYVDIGGGGIRRIEYTAAANQPPVAVANGEPDERRHRYDRELRRLGLQRPQRRSTLLRMGS